jgi:hypothetical protein
MSISKNKLQEIITLYLNDIEDYSTPTELILAEAALSPFKNLLTEGKKSTKQLIQEVHDNATSETKPIIKDFLLYLNQI